jgi:hypothetical protein
LAIDFGVSNFTSKSRLFDLSLHPTFKVCFFCLKIGMLRLHKNFEKGLMWVQVEAGRRDGGCGREVGVGGLKGVEKNSWWVFVVKIIISNKII